MEILTDEDSYLHSKRSSSVSSWLRKWFQFLLLKTKYPMASHFIDVENIEYYSLNCTANVSSEVLFHQFILTLYWFAMLIRGSLWPEGSQYFLVYFNWWFFSGLLWLGQSQFREGIKIIRYTSQRLLFKTGSSFKSLFKSIWIIYSFFFKRKHSTFFSSRYFNNNSYNNNNMQPTLARHLSHLY